MILSDNEIQKLIKEFSKQFTPDYLIKIERVEVVDLFYQQALEITVHPKEGRGLGREVWSYEFAAKLLKEPKELDLCGHRWREAFKTAIENAKPLNLNAEFFDQPENSEIN